MISTAATMRHGILLCLLLTCLGLMAGNGVMAQGNCSYQITHLGGYTQVELDQAMGQASLDAYRFKTQRRVLQFENGAEVQLLSATELQNLGCAVDGSLAMEDNRPVDGNRRFSILPGGYLYESTAAVYKINPGNGQQ